MEWYEIVISVLTGLATAIPLVIKLVEYVKKSIKEKNWDKLLQLVMNLMAEAELKFEDGKTRKEWVLDMVVANSNVLDYDIDIAAVDAMIESLIVLSRNVNAPNTKEVQDKE